MSQKMQSGVVVDVRKRKNTEFDAVLRLGDFSIGVHLTGIVNPHDLEYFVKEVIEAEQRIASSYSADRH